MASSPQKSYREHGCEIMRAVDLPLIDKAKILLEDLNTCEAKKDKAHTLESVLLDVKSSQRKMFQQLETAVIRRDQRRKELERQKLILENLVYERSHLQSQLEKCKEHPTPNLSRMCRDELDDEASSMETTMNVFLCGAAETSVQDPKNNETVMKKLHTELNARGTLQRDLESAQSNLSKRKKISEEERSFLNDIPKKLEMIERSSATLQKFFQSSTTNHSLRFIGTDRKRRLDCARSISGPLYSLFVQLQTNLDDRGDSNITIEITKHKKESLEEVHVALDPKVIHLTFIIPDVHSKEFGKSKKKRVTVEFAFVQKYSLVIAHSFGFLEKVNLPPLLDNLLPGDTGEWIAQPEDAKGLPGKPFHWCNFLAGVHLPQSFQTTTQGRDQYLSTNLVIRQLTKKIRVFATLTQILEFFEKKTPVAHPSLRSELHLSDCKARLATWTCLNDESDRLHDKTAYSATIKYNSSTLSVRVLVDWSSYPTSLPEWSLCEGEVQWTRKDASTASLHSKSSPLYNHLLGQIESEVNGDVTALVDCSDSTSFDWIISHQLIKLMQLWGKSQDNVKDLGMGESRGNKGRDRSHS